MMRQLGNIGLRGFVLAAVALISTQLAGAASLVPNHDFEVDAEPNGFPDDWFHGSSTGYPDDDSDGVGTKSASILGNSDLRSLAIAVTPGEEMTWSMDYKVLSGSTGTARFQMRFFSGVGGDGGTIGAFAGEDNFGDFDVTSVASDAWQSTGPRTIIVPAGGNYADFRLTAGLFAGAFDGELRLDNIQLARPIPEPSTVVLLAFSAIALFVVRRKRR